MDPAPDPPEDEMNDDENRELTWSDLSLETPSDRAVLRYQLVRLEEDVTSPGHTGWLGDTDFERLAGFEPPPGSSPRSSRNEALTTLCLGLTVSLIAGVAWGIGLPPVTALIAGFVGAFAIYMVVYVTSDRPGQ